MSILGIDLGTGACKAWFLIMTERYWARQKKIISRSARTRVGANWRLKNLWMPFAKSHGNFPPKFPDHPIEAMAISSHGETIIPVGFDRRAIAPAYMSADYRSGEEIAELVSKLGEKRIYEITGMPPHPMYAVGNIMWLKSITRKDMLLPINFVPAKILLCCGWGWTRYVIIRIAAVRKCLIAETGMVYGNFRCGGNRHRKVKYAGSVWPSGRQA